MITKTSSKYFNDNMLHKDIFIHRILKYFNIIENDPFSLTYSCIRHNIII